MAIKISYYLWRDMINKVNGEYHKLYCPNVVGAVYNRNEKGCWMGWMGDYDEKKGWCEDNLFYHNYPTYGGYSYRRMDIEMDIELINAGFTHGIYRRKCIIDKHMGKIVIIQEVQELPKNYFYSGISQEDDKI